MTMRILFLNWRCPRHPRAGGAELLTWRIAERLVKWGHSVTWFSASFPGAAAVESIDGIQIVRQGGQTSVHWHAWRWHRQHARGNYDVVVDEINTIPFFAPLYADAPVVAFIPQLAREVWWHEAPLYLAPVGYGAEPLYLQVYRRTPIITISASTVVSLRALRLKGPIAIIPMATDFPTEANLIPLAEKESELTLIFVGRVVPSKRVDHMICALAQLRQMGISAHLWIAGSADPDYRAKLDADVQKHELASAVQFLGKVGDEEKRQLLKKAHVLLVCSVREGWGLTVTEANAVGTPAVVYNVPGLRDSTLHGQTGLICAINTPDSLAETIAKLWRDPDHYERLRRGALDYSRTLNWDVTAAAFWAALRL